MKRISALGLSAFLLTTSNIYAATPGVYLGLGGGIGTYLSPNGPVFVVSGTNSSTTYTRGGLSGRAFAGYNYNMFLGLETGYTRYARSLYTGTSSIGAYSSVSYYPREFDVVGKAYLPLWRTGFDLYILGGAARVSVTTNYTNNGIPLNSRLAPPSTGTTHTYKTRPIYGAGLGYNFNERLSTNVEWTQIQHSGNFNTNPYAIPNMDLLTLNLAYHFC